MSGVIDWQSRISSIRLYTPVQVTLIGYTQKSDKGKAFRNFSGFSSQEEKVGVGKQGGGEEWGQFFCFCFKVGFNETKAHTHKNQCKALDLTLSASNHFMYQCSPENSAFPVTHHSQCAAGVDHPVDSAAAWLYWHPRHWLRPGADGWSSSPCFHSVHKKNLTQIRIYQ